MENQDYWIIFDALISNYGVLRNDANKSNTTELREIYIKKMAQSEIAFAKVCSEIGMKWTTLAEHWAEVDKRSAEFLNN